MSLKEECDLKEDRFIEHLEICSCCQWPASSSTDLCPSGSMLFMERHQAQVLWLVSLPTTFFLSSVPQTLTRT